MVRNILLISNSTLYGSNYLEHCQEQIVEVLNLNGIKKILFIPYARPSAISYDEYTSIAYKKFKELGFDLKGIHTYSNPKEAVRNAEAIFIGGGNSFLLLKSLYDIEIIDEIREKVKLGMPYIGTSAGSNVAGKSIMTTNDMPIMYPPSFKSIGLVPFHINPHYLETDLNSTHMGETRDTRIKEFLTFNDEIVVALKEGAMLHITDDNITLKGISNAKIFRKNKDIEEYEPNSILNII